MVGFVHLFFMVFSSERTQGVSSGLGTFLGFGCGLTAYQPIGIDWGLTVSY
jgi:hypothetical protein